MATALLDPMEIRLLNERYYRGVMVMEIMKLSLVSADSKRIKLYAIHRVIVLGQVLEDEGRMVCMELDHEHMQEPKVTSGLAMENFDIEWAHWCSGLAIKHVHKTTADGNRDVSSTETDLKNARKNLAMEILRTIDDSANSVKAWEEVDWKGFEVSQVSIESCRAY